MLRDGDPEAHHPSDQVRGYTLYCRKFHSTVLKQQASVDGCVYFTRPGSIRGYRLPPNKQLVDDFPVFSLYEERDTRRFSEFVADRLAAGDPDFAAEFAKGRYIQDRNLLRQVAASLRTSTARPFVLLDEQRRGFAVCLNVLEQVRREKDRRQVVIVQGPPGSGKSALAANLWIESAERFADGGNIVFVTTSSCQSTNWEQTFEVHAALPEARFLTKRSNDFNPGLTGQIVARLRRAGHPMDYHDWQSCLKVFHAAEYPTRVPDLNHHISIVDEAHALINPESHDIGFASGWTVQAGPQAYHIIRASQISVFLLDGRQSYRDNETTSVDDIREFAKRLGADVTEVSLEGQQFRCGGSVEYLNWVEQLLAGKTPEGDSSRWRRTAANPDRPFLFELVDTPADLDARLAPLADGGEAVRLVSSYSVPWKTSYDPATQKKWVRPADYKRFMASIAPEQCDFRIPFLRAGHKETWSRPWNFAPKEDYTLFIQAPPGSMMARNPLAEVGCPYVLRGFDYDYLGVLWLEDLVWRSGRWIIQPAHVHETAIKSTLAAPRKDLLSKRHDTRGSGPPRAHYPGLPDPAQPRNQGDLPLRPRRGDPAASGRDYRDLRARAESAAQDPGSGNKGPHIPRGPAAGVARGAEPPGDRPSGNMTKAVPHARRITPGGSGTTDL